MNIMGLRYGAFDFIVDKSGDYFFLECNPSGQWLWLEKVTDVNISQAVANELTTMHVAFLEES